MQRINQGKILIFKVVRCCVGPFEMAGHEIHSRNVNQELTTGLT